MNQKRIGLFGGSFDPPHLGHEALALAALQQLALDELWVIPAGVPVHRQLTPSVDAEKRYAWVAEMFASEPRIRVKSWEAACTAPVAAVDTLRRFREESGGNVPVWISGADSYASMSGWIGYPEHMQLCNVAVFSRAGEAAPRLHAGWKALTLRQWLDAVQCGAGHALVIDAELPDISATQVRTAAAAGASLNGLVNSRICEEVGQAYRAG